ncbi:cytochrome P450 [Nocardia brasiliensis]|uniref:Cytochrome P450 n=1 Tax=Nocardia brasiliensis TaxID=37326 RepID=A0A6G9XQS4_NOCBR|nr:cytochrome P450 [Nocardia brasiliensis]QIS03256.1 cytochrome P450 [Nocardia brasiliensis]
MSGPDPVFPMRRPSPFELPADYHAMREGCPVGRATLRDGAPVWLVTGYADVRSVLTDPGLSADRGAPGFPFLTAESEYLRRIKVFVGMDAPEHGVYRRMFTPEFSARKVAALRPYIQRCVDERIDRLLDAGPPADFVRAIALPVPALAIGRILGVPEADTDLFEELTVRVITHGGAQPFEALVDYVKQLVRAKHGSTAHDLISRVLREHVAPGRLELRALTIVLILILLAGYETTANTLSLGLLALLRHPAQWAALRADPSALPGAIAELLRYTSVAELATCRATTREVEVAGTTIPAGAGVIPLAAAANRDPSVFPNPEVLDIHRDAQRHLAFGYGAHACMGAALAQLELDIVFRTVLARLPELRLDGELPDAAVKYDSVLFGLHQLPLTW